MRSHGRRDVCSQDHQTPDAPLGYRGIDRLTKSARKPSLSKGPGCILSCLSASLLVVNINWTAHCAEVLHRPSIVVAGVNGISPNNNFELARDTLVAALA
jgi:hypothetical protein